MNEKGSEEDSRIGIDGRIEVKAKRGNAVGREIELEVSCEAGSLDCRTVCYKVVFDFFILLVNVLFIHYATAK